MKDYNLGADVYPDFNHEKIYGRKSDFKDVEEFKRYLIGEEYADKDYVKNSNIKTIYMRYLPKGNFYSDNEPCYIECKKGKGAAEYYVFNLC